MTTEETNGATINIAPTWETAIRVYRAVIENPEAPERVKAEAWQEIFKLAKHVDAVQGQEKS